MMTQDPHDWHCIVERSRQHASVILQMSLTARVCCGLQACGETLGEDWKKERGLSVFVCTLRLRTREDVGETEVLRVSAKG